jgi:diaminopimelate decarboxylase
MRSKRQDLASLALDLFPDSAALEGGELRLGGVGASALAEEFGTPLVVYCERTLRARARAYREAAPDGRILYSVKAFPNVALLRLLAEEGLGAEVSALGELEFARRAGIAGNRILVDGNNKSDDEVRAAAETGASFVVDAPDDLERARAAGVRGDLLVRVTPGIDAETHDAIRTGHTGSKFGLPPDDALEAIGAGGVTGLHVHIGSQLLDLGAERMTIDWLAGFAAACRARFDWTPSVVDLGGGLGIRYLADDPVLPVRRFVETLVENVERAWQLHDLPRPELILEPGRSLVGDAAVSLYRVGVVKRASETTTYVAVDGGMSDNPRPQLYGARFSAFLAGRMDEEPAAAFTVCGKHCESGDVLIDRVRLPEPRRGDLLVVPATGAYTLGMASNYNGVPRPAAVLVADGRARLIRRRETLDDLLGLESDGEGKAEPK